MISRNLHKLQKIFTRKKSPKWLSSEVEKEYKKVHEKWPESELADDSYKKTADFYRKIAQKRYKPENTEENKKNYKRVTEKYAELEKEFPKSPFIKDGRKEGPVFSCSDIKNLSTYSPGIEGIPPGKERANIETFQTV